MCCSEPGFGSLRTSCPQCFDNITTETWVICVLLRLNGVDSSCLSLCNRGWVSQKLRPVDWIIYCTKSLEMSRWLIKPQITTDISTREELRLPVLKSRPETFTPERLQMAVLSHIPSCPLGWLKIVFAVFIGYSLTFSPGAMTKSTLLFFEMSTQSLSGGFTAPSWPDQHLFGAPSLTHPPHRSDFLKGRLFTHLFGWLFFVVVA